jgi:hypothetical protein
MICGEGETRKLPRVSGQGDSAMHDHVPMWLIVSNPRIGWSLLEVRAWSRGGGCLWRWWVREQGVGMAHVRAVWVVGWCL